MQELGWVTLEEKRPGIFYKYRVKFHFFHKTGGGIFCGRSKVGAGVARFFGGSPAVFHSGGRTVTDAGHAVGAVFTPHGLAFYQRNIFRGTVLGTAAAAHTFFGDEKPFGGDNEAVKQTIDGIAAQFINELWSWFGQRSACGHQAGYTVNVGMGGGENGGGLFRAGSPEKGDIIFRHDDARRAHIAQTFLLTEGFGVEPGPRDGIAASEDEIDLSVFV